MERNNIINNFSDETLTTFVMYYALFKKKILNSDEEKKIIELLPENAFGVFTSTRRNHKLDSWPEDIHGCIGYWDNDFKTLKKDILYDNLLRVSYDSVWSDHRRSYFDAIETDPLTYIELDFMMNPIYEIEKETGMILGLNKKFTNDIYGIIIQSDYGRATYLPHVFDNISWNELVSSIKSKAGISSNDFHLYAYKIKQIKTQLITLLTGNIYSYISLYKFSRILIDNVKLNRNFPFIYSCRDNFEWNDKDDVRNIATIGELYRYINLCPKIASKKEKDFIRNKIINILANLDKYSSQSLSFLGYFYSELEDKNTLKNKLEYCNKLIKDYEYADEEFGKPEIIIGLNEAKCNSKNILKKSNKDTLLEFNSDDSIFKMNWTIQAIISFNEKPKRELVRILENKIIDIINDKKRMETNYLAVSFEALCFVFNSLGDKSILNKIFELFYELETRKNCDNSLYSFLNKSSRVDISGHINNGFVEIRKYYQNQKNQNQN